MQRKAFPCPEGTLNSSSCLENSDSDPPQTTGCNEIHSLSTTCDCATKLPHSQHPHADPQQQPAFPTSNTSNYHLRTPLMSPGAIRQLLMTTWGQSRVDSMAPAGSSLWEDQPCANPYPSKHTTAEARQAEQPAHLPAPLNAAFEGLPSPIWFPSCHGTTWPPEEPICRRFTLLFQFFLLQKHRKMSWDGSCLNITLQL